MIEKRLFLRFLNHLKKYSWMKRQLLKARISHDFPIYLHIEPTNACNLRCSFCPTSKNEGIKKGYMGLQLYRKIIDECGRHKKVMLILLHKDGEPLLHPDLPEMVRYAKEKRAGRIIHFATNGILLNEGKTRELISSGLDDILISLDTPQGSTYLALKGADRLREIEENIARLVKMRNRLKKKAPFIRVKMVDMEKNHSEISLFQKRWDGVVDKVDISGFVNWPQFEKFDFPGVGRKRQYACPALWYSPAINWDGKVSICCVDGDKKRIIGDVNSDSISDIWQGERLKAIRKAHLNGDFGICGNCSYWSLEPNIESWLRSKEKSR